MYLLVCTFTNVSLYVYCDGRSLPAAELTLAFSLDTFINYKQIVIHLTYSQVEILKNPVNYIYFFKNVNHFIFFLNYITVRTF